MDAISRSEPSSPAPDAGGEIAAVGHRHWRTDVVPYRLKELAYMHDPRMRRRSLEAQAKKEAKKAEEERERRERVEEAKRDKEREERKEREKVEAAEKEKIQ